MIDDYTLQHLGRWAAAHSVPQETIHSMLCFIVSHPYILEHHSWSEIEFLATRVL